MGKLITVSLCFVLAACSTGRNFDPQGLQFKTLITPDHVKRFELSIAPRPVPIDPLSDRRGLESGPSERQLKAMLKDALADNGFCREGFLPLGRYAGESNYKLRGECKDAASVEDIARFPNTIERW
ncbi:MAG: hypothetical protein EOO68_09795 [Moraxellaceae bacterium]|jgi:hypothetical protein|nr:MAG: hypothetical protein EOO68_09795 [Moraxellaceae bacterium]